MFRKVYHAVLLLLLAINLPIQLNAKVVMEELYFADFDQFFVSDLNFTDFSQQPFIFRYRIWEENHAESYPQKLSFTLTFRANIPRYGINEEIFVVSAESMNLDQYSTKKGFEIEIDNQKLSADHFEIYTKKADRIEFDAKLVDKSNNFGEIQNAVFQTGALPDGQYIFDLKIDSDGEITSASKSILIENPTTIELISPGAELQYHEEVATKYPIFQWNSMGCDRYGIRICEYDPTLHISAEDALDDESILPFPDNGGYYEAGAAVSFQFPLTSARDLEVGKTYVWRVQKICTTSSIRGSEEIESNIFSFTVRDVAAGSEGGASPEQYDPILNALKELIGEGLFEEYFSHSGALNGYAPTGTIISNGEKINYPQLLKIVSEANRYEIEVKNVYIEE